MKKENEINEILKREKLLKRFVVEVFDEKAADVSFYIMGAEDTLDSTIIEAWKEWDKLPKNGHRKSFCNIEVSRQIVEETETGALQFFDYENSDNEEIAEYSRSFNEDNEGLYYISSTSGQEMDELREYVRSWVKGEPLDDIDISKMEEDDFLELLYKKYLVSRETIDSYKKWVR